MAAPSGMPPMYGQPPPPNVGYLPPGGVGSEVAGDGGALEALMGALCWQVEYYFSVENLVSDMYLRNLMDAEGFVAVSKVLYLFRRVARRGASAFRDKD